MKTFLILLLACVTVAYCAKAKKQIHDEQSILDGYEFEYAPHDAPALGLIESSSHYVEAAPTVAVAASGHRPSHLVRPGYSVGGPLASIAKGKDTIPCATSQLNDSCILVEHTSA